ACFLRLKPLPLSQLQRRQGEQGEDERRNPKSNDNLRFAPSQQLEMMMNRSHAQNALAAQFERSDLQDYGQCFDHKNPADKEQQNLLLDDDSDRSECAAERK